MGKNNTLSDSTASRYSLALFELAEENKCVQEIEEQCFKLVKFINENEDFNSVIKNPTNKKNDLLNILKNISDHYKFNILLKNFLCFLVEKRRLFFVDLILKTFVDICSNRKGEVSAKLTSAKELTVDEIKKIKDELSQNFSTKINLNYKYDQSLIGGLIIQVGSVMIDTSIKHKLQKIENRMIEA